MIRPLRLSVAELTEVPTDLGALVETHLASTGALPVEYITALEKVAVTTAEGETHRTFVARSHAWVLADFPHDGYQAIRLPRGKTQTVDSIVYVRNNQQFTLTGPDASPPGTGFRQDLTGDDGGVIMPPYGESWPSVDYDSPAPVTISFTAGWDAASVPMDAVRWMLFDVADAVEIRNSIDMGVGNADRMLRDSLLSSFRLKRWY